MSMVAQELPSAEQVLRLITSQQETIRDVSFYYEGGFRVLPESGAKFKPDPSWYDAQFQGLYAFRDDGRVFQEIFNRHNGKTSQRSAVLDGKSDEVLEGSTRVNKVTKEKPRPFSDPYVLTEPESAHRFLYRYMLKALDTRGTAGVSVEDWDVIDDRKCVKVRVVMWPAFGNEAYHLFWIDLERGGHPLRIENWLKGQRRYRINVKLNSFKDLEGRAVWLPASGVFESFHWSGHHYDQPVARETYDLVHGSVLINAGLTDAQMRNPRTRVQNAPAGFKNGKEVGEIEADKNENVAEGSVHPIRIQERLDSMLAEANEQSKTVDASNVTADDEWVRSVLPLVLVVLGILCVAGAIVLRNRQSSISRA